MQPIPKRRIRNSTFWKPSAERETILNSHSWFDIKNKKLDSVCGTKVENTNTLLRCKRVDINPTHKQRNILKTWLEIYRQVYNITVHYFRSHKILSLYKARDRMRIELDKNTYLCGLIKNSAMPLHTVNHAIFDVIKAYKTAFSNLKNKNIKHFRLRYKKINKHAQSLVLESSLFHSNKKGLTVIKNKITTRNNRKLRKCSVNLTNLNPVCDLDVKHDVRLQFNSRTNRFTLHVPMYKKIVSNRHKLNKCALDPGIRTFQTVYSDSGICYQIGSSNTNSHLKTLIDRIENVNDKKNKNWYKKYTNRLRERIKNLTTDLHWKVAKFLCRRFNTILIGNMSTKGIIKSRHSVLTPAQKRFCVALSHYTFRLRLESKCQEYSVKYKCVDESYTSKTCGSCGEINENLGSSEIFTCPKENCHYTMHRDIHGARNILIKNTKN